jgi:hypothetical protein
MVNYILAILRYAIPQFWRKFYMKYPSGTEMVDKRDPVYQPGDDSVCDTAKVESHIDQRPIDPVDWLLMLSGIMNVAVNINNQSTSII